MPNCRILFSSQPYKRSLMPRRSGRPVARSYFSCLDSNHPHEEDTVKPVAIFALIVFFTASGLFLSSATVSYASSSSDGIPFCLPFAYERERSSTYAAGKRADLDGGELRTVRMIYFSPPVRCA